MDLQEANYSQSSILMDILWNTYICMLLVEGMSLQCV